MNKHGPLGIRVVHNFRCGYRCLESSFEIRNKHPKVGLDFPQTTRFQENMRLINLRKRGYVSHMHCQETAFRVRRQRQAQIQPQSNEINEIVPSQGLTGDASHNPPQTSKTVRSGAKATKLRHPDTFCVPYSDRSHPATTVNKNPDSTTDIH